MKNIPVQLLFICNQHSSTNSRVDVGNKAWEIWIDSQLKMRISFSNSTIQSPTHLYYSHI